MIDQKRLGALATAARTAAGLAYCPYSKFPVGAAVLGENGEIYSGCNVENASFGLTICAERNAIQGAAAHGVRSIQAVVIYTPTTDPAAPCGACRQVIREFGRNVEIICVCDGSETLRLPLESLLPTSFGPEDMGCGLHQAMRGNGNILQKADTQLLRMCIDIDNVVARTDEVMRKLISDFTGGRVDLRYEDVDNFNYWQCRDGNGNSISKAEWKSIHDVFSQPENLQLVKPVEGVQNHLRKLSNCFSLHLATSRLPRARKATVEWLEKHNFPSHALHFTQHGEKHVSLGNFIASIEDDLEQAEAFANHGIMMSYVVAHPWNASLEERRNLRRVTNWDELVDSLLRLANEV